MLVVQVPLSWKTTDLDGVTVLHDFYNHGLYMTNSAFANLTVK
jgi:hypothetical protein